MKFYTPHISVEDAIKCSLDHANENNLLSRWNETTAEHERLKPARLGLIHTDWRRDGAENPTYYDHELPAVGIFASGKEADDESKAGISLLPVEAVLSIVAQSGDPTWAAREAKAITGCLAQHFRDLRSGDTDDDVNGITRIARLIAVGEDVTRPAYQTNRSWTGEAALKLTITIATEG